MSQEELLSRARRVRYVQQEAADILRPNLDQPSMVAYMDQASATSRDNMQRVIDAIDDTIEVLVMDDGPDIGALLMAAMSLHTDLVKCQHYVGNPMSLGPWYVMLPSNIATCGECMRKTGSPKNIAHETQCDLCMGEVPDNLFFSGTLVFGIVIFAFSVGSCCHPLVTGMVEW